MNEDFFFPLQQECPLFFPPPLLVLVGTSSTECNGDTVSRYSCFIFNLGRKTSKGFFFLLSSVLSLGSLQMSFTKPSVSRNSLWVFLFCFDFCQILFLCPAFWCSVSKIYYFKWLRIRYWHFKLLQNFVFKLEAVWFFSYVLIIVVLCLFL